ncbi:MAG: alpha-amylase family glycosyl hydrolase [Candidatus Saccharibacteria bacterium]|nr:alpha-amylase family glycosyl hydrolase [Candidatus Saccharibacteria bacterium]
MSKQLGVELFESYAIFRVWAPFAREVAILGDFSNWQPVPMTKDETDGIWEVKINDVQAGHAYKYQIKGYDDIVRYHNDPRAIAVTDSDDGNGVVSDGKFDWGDFGKLVMVPRDRQVLYEMHIGTFVRPDAATPGNFQTAISKLDYLRDLGVTTIELMPITSMATSYGWGYAPSALYSVENSYGGSWGLKKFVKEAHKRGLAVILDVVYNHFGPRSAPWQFDGWSENNRGGIYFYNDNRGDTPWGSRPDYGRPEVRDFILDNVSMWLNDYHVDGFRLDSTIYMRNTAGHNNDPAHDIGDAWQLMTDIVKRAHKIKSDSLVIAEDCSGNGQITNSPDYGGAGFDSQWDLGLPHVIRGALHVNGEQPGLQNLINVQGQSFNGDWCQRVVFSDSHDTAANGNERLVATVSPDTHSVSGRRIAILSSAIALTTPGIPMILAGSEFLQGGSFNEWNALDWDNVDKFSGIVDAHRHLIALRTNQYGDTGGLLSGDIKVLMRDDECRVLMYQRGSDHDQPVIVVANFSGLKWTDYKLPLPYGDWQVKFNSSWKGYSADFAELKVDTINAGTSLTLPPHVVLIMTKA